MYFWPLQCVFHYADHPMVPVSGPLECTVVCHEPILRLCKNTMKRYGSKDSGYHSNFSHIYKTSLTPRPEAVQVDDEVDW